VVQEINLLSEVHCFRNFGTQDGFTPLMAASLSGDVPLAKFLVSKGADLAATNTV